MPYLSHLGEWYKLSIVFKGMTSLLIMKVCIQKVHFNLPNIFVYKMLRIYHYFTNTYCVKSVSLEGSPGRIIKKSMWAIWEFLLGWRFQINK